MAELQGERQQAFLKASAEIDASLGLRGQQLAAIGAWKDGAENTVVTDWKSGDYEKIKLAEVMKGSLANQKSVLLFRDHPGGTAVLAEFQATGQVPDIYQHLLDDGVAFHTLIPDAHGAKVFVVDTDGSAGASIRKAADRYGSEVRIRNGEAEFIGTTLDSGTDTEQRQDAQRVYSGILSGAGSKGLGGDAIWSRVRDRWGTTFAKFAKRLEEIRKARE
jgi:hypothetical protein